MKLTPKHIRDAHKYLKDHLTPTPLVYSDRLSLALGCEVYLKLETMQAIGSFKIRGATYKIANLPKDKKKLGVIAASAGNHGQGVAWASRKLKVRSTIVMPKQASLTKVENCRALGAKVILEGKDIAQSYEHAKKIARKKGMTLIHPYEDQEIMSGQGTVGLEIMKQLPDLDVLISSVGGGGLLTGASVVIKDLLPKVKIIGCQATGAPSMVKAIKRGRQVKLDGMETFADGIAIPKNSEKVRKLLQPLVSEWVTCSDEQIAEGVLELLEKAKVVAEGAGALPLAAAKQLQSKLKGKKVVLLIGGGNIDVNIMSRILDRGLIQSGRRVRVMVRISDRPGSLNRLTEKVASMEASIVQAIHDRNGPSQSIDQTEVALTLETKGPKHTKATLEAIAKEVEDLQLLS